MDRRTVGRVKPGTGHAGRIRPTGRAVGWVKPTAPRSPLETGRRTRRGLVGFTHPTRNPDRSTGRRCPPKTPSSSGLTRGCRIEGGSTDQREDDGAREGNPMTLEQQRSADDKMRAEIAKLFEETSKLRVERVWYPFVVVGGLFAAAIALAKLLAS